MNNKKRAFTLVELLAVVAISAILLFIATDRLIGDSFRANATYNQRVDVQTGVKTSMDNIKSILKRAIQVHRVGQEVYKEDMNLNRLDKKYNYIAFRSDGNGNRFLANIVYDKATDKFNVLPLTAGDKKDIMTGDKIDYNLEFYKNDNNYRKKLDNDMINITITGKSKANVLGKGINDEFELKEDIQLPNVNQVLLSRHLQGGVEKITALAYDNGVIQPGKTASKAGIVLIMDSSGSMLYNMVDPMSSNHSSYPFKVGNRFRIGWDRRTNLRPATYSYSWSDVENPYNNHAAPRTVVLGNALYNSSDGLLKQLHNIAVAKNMDFEAYIFDYGWTLDDYSEGNFNFRVASPYNYSARYLTTLDLAHNKGYGPFNLGTTEGYNKAVETVRDKANMKFNIANHDVDTPAMGGGATNTGYAILTGLEILQQMKESGIEKRFFVLLTDGSPNLTAALGDNRDKNVINRAFYNSNRGNGLSYGGRKKPNGDYVADEAIGMQYIKDVTSAASGNNPKGLYEFAMLIGLSGIPDEVKRLGVPNPGIQSYSINNYMRQTGNETKAYVAKDYGRLKDAFKNLSDAIGISLGVFDGPDRMK